MLRTLSQQSASSVEEQSTGTKQVQEGIPIKACREQQRNMPPGHCTTWQVRLDGPVAVNLQVFFQPCECWSVENTTFIGGAAATAGSILNLRNSFWAQMSVPGGGTQDPSRTAEVAGPCTKWPKSSTRGDVMKRINEVCEKRLGLQCLLLRSAPPNCHSNPVQ